MTNQPVFQLQGAEKVIKALSSKNKVCALCFETGLGKTHVVAQVAKNLVRFKRNQKIILYFASNLNLAEANANKLADTLKKLGLPNVHHTLTRITLLPNVLRDFEREYGSSQTIIVGLTPDTSMSLRGAGNREEKVFLRDCLKQFRGSRIAQYRVDRYRGLLGTMGRWGSKWNRRAKARAQTFRRDVAAEILKECAPDLIILDEFHRYAAALPSFLENKVGTNKKRQIKANFNLFSDLLKGYGNQTSPLILVSATPYEAIPTILSGEKVPRTHRHGRDFDRFLYLISRLDEEEYKSWLKDRLDHEAKIKEFFRAGKNDRDELNSLIDGHVFKRRLKDVLIEQTRESKGEVSARSVGDFNLTVDEVFTRIAKLHSVVQGSREAIMNRTQILSSDSFVSLRGKSNGKKTHKVNPKKRVSGRRRQSRKFHYVLGDYVHSKGLQAKWNSQLKEGANGVDGTVWKKKAVLLEAQENGLVDDRGCAQALWVPPVNSKNRLEKMLIFSSVAAVAPEVLEVFSDQKLLKIRIEKAWKKPFTKLHRRNPANPFIVPSRTKWDGLSLRFGMRSQSPGVAVVQALAEALLRRTSSLDETTLREVMLEAISPTSVRLGIQLGLENYFGSQYAKTIVERWNSRKNKRAKNSRLKPKAYMRVLTDYCVDFGWADMWVEYWDQLLGRDQFTVTVESIQAMLERGTVALRDLRPAHVTSAKNRRVGRGKKKIWYQSHMAEKYGDASSVQKMNRPHLLRDAFNSPFAPFVLIINSSGQEGLDFHSYCRTTVHYEPPNSATDYLQRAGRVFRLRGYAQRVFLSKNLGRRFKSGFIWDEAQSLARQVELLADAGHSKSGMVPEFDLPNVDEMVTRHSIFVTPYSTEVAQSDRLRAALPFVPYFTHLPAVTVEKLIGLVTESRATLTLKSKEKKSG